MTLQEKQLGQLRPANTTAASLYSPAVGVTAIVKALYVTNTSLVVATFRICVDDNGSTFDESTALFWDVTLNANTTLELYTFIAMNDSAGNIGVRTDTANALTFTAFGAEIT